MKDLKYAIIMAAIVGAVLFHLCELDEKKAHRLENNDYQTFGHNIPNDQVAGVNIGQNPTNEDREDNNGGGADAEYKKAFPEIFETKSQIVAFTAVWCGPCKLQKIQTAALKGRFNVLTYDVDEDHGRELYARFNGKALPTTIILVDGKEKKRWEGYIPASQIEPFAEEARKTNEKTRFNRLRINGSGWRLDVDLSNRRCGISAAAISNGLSESPCDEKEQKRDYPLPTPAILVGSRNDGTNQLPGEDGFLYRTSGKRVPKHRKGQRQLPR